MTDFCPVTLPEDPTPAGQTGCNECGLYEHGSRMIWGEGNPHAAIMIVLDNPGEREDRDGNPYVCGTRQTLQKAASEVGFNLDDLYITYILKRRPRKKYDKPRTRAICMQHLERQIQQKQPALIFCMGNVAVQSFFQDEHVEVKSLRGSIHDVNGIPTAVAYHPLAIRRRPNLEKMFLEDWTDAARYYKEGQGNQRDKRTDR